MPPKFKFTREEITNAAVRIARREGIDAVTARSVAKELDSSTRVIFGLFENMEELIGSVIAQANRLYRAFIREETEKGKYPAYKASGMAYIRFAREETELFRLLFMRDRTGNVPENEDGYEDIIELTAKSTGIGIEDAKLFHLEMWIFVHGIATLIATSYQPMDDEFISRIVTDAYMGIRHRFLHKEGE